MTDGAPVLLVPLRIEAAVLRRARGEAKVVRTGMGPARAELTRARLQRSLGPEVPVAVLGLGAGLSASDRPGDVVVASEIVAIGESGVQVLDGELAGRLGRALARAGLGSVRVGRVVSVRSLVPAADTASRPEAEGALACDMESAWLAPLGDRRPFAVVRVVVDRPGHGLNGPWVVGSGIAALRHLRGAGSVVTRELTAGAAAVKDRT